MRTRAPAKAPRVIRQLLSHLGVPNEVQPDPLRYTISQALRAAALWENPLFVRMTPTSGFEVALLAIQSVALGLYLGTRRPSCAAGTASVGGVLGFLGIACPVCNKILVMIFGSGLLLTYFEPIRIYVALAGALLMSLALWWRLSSVRTRVVEARG